MAELGALQAEVDAPKRLQPARTNLKDQGPRIAMPGGPEILASNGRTSFVVLASVCSTDLRPMKSGNYFARVGHPRSGLGGEMASRLGVDQSAQSG